VVLLKNAARVLPLARTGKVFVTGGAAVDVSRQTGGAAAEGTTILDGIRQVSGGAVTYQRDGVGIDRSYRAAVAVVGAAGAAADARATGVADADQPATLAPDPRDLAAVDRIRAAGVPVVVVLVSGRPLDVAARMPGWNALLTAWLPGTDGRGVADVLFGDHNPAARLPVTWMTDAAQQPINDGDGKPSAFPYGFGLSYPATATPSATQMPAGTRPPPAGPPSPPRPAPCSVAYRVVNQWDVGFQADVTIRNTGTAGVNGWRLVWNFGRGQRITQLWGGEARSRGATVTVVNAAWNGALAPGATATVGFTASRDGPNPAPVAFRLNGSACQVR
jgi:beta-glucosidase